MPSLTALPTEIILAIAKSLGPSDIKGLSCVNRRLRNAVTHILFRTLSIAMPLVSHLLLEHMLKKYESVITQIHLHVHLRPNLEEDGDNIEYTSIGGTTKSDTLLQLVNGEILPHIDSFSIHFDPCQFDIAGRWYGNDGDWGGGHGSGSITVFEDEEDEDECFEREEEHVWRRHYMQVLAEIMRNPNIRKLRIENLLPRRTSIFNTLQWKRFLGQLTHFDIGMFGAECDGWSVNAMTGFTQFVCDFLPKDIMNYLVNVKHLRLAASELSVFGAGIYGDSFYSFDMFPLTGRIPTLLSLELKNIVLGDMFMAYLQTQGDNLRELTLHNCMCLSPTEGQFDEWPHTEPGEVQWSDIWACILLRIPAMRRVTFVQNEQPPLPPAYSRLVEEMLEAGEDLTVWRYITIDEDWGNVHEDEEANFEEVRLGNACTIYGEMMKVLADRRESEESADEE